MEVDGRLVGSCLNGGQPAKSEIACPISIAGTGTVEALSGPLILNGPVFGTGALQIDSSATLTVNSTLASTVKVILTDATSAAPANFTLGPYTSFGGAITCLGAYDVIALNLNAAFTGTVTGFAASDTIVLGPKAVFTGVIAGFGVGGTIDLLSTKATGASINAMDQLVIVNGSTIVATLQLTGTYNAATFHIASDGAGGTDVTLASAGARPPSGAPPPAPSVHALVSAMAGLGARAGPTVAPSTHDDPFRPTLLAPRAQLA